MKAGIKDTVLQNRKLQEQEKILRTQYDQVGIKALSLGEIKLKCFRNIDGVRCWGNFEI